MSRYFFCLGATIALVLVAPITGFGYIGFMGFREVELDAIGREFCEVALFREGGQKKVASRLFHLDLEAKPLPLLVVFGRSIPLRETPYEPANSSYCPGSGFTDLFREKSERECVVVINGFRVDTESYLLEPFSDETLESRAQEPAQPKLFDLAVKEDASAAIVFFGSSLKLVRDQEEHPHRFPSLGEWRPVDRMIKGFPVATLWYSAELVPEVSLRQMWNDITGNTLWFEGPYPERWKFVDGFVMGSCWFE